MTELDTEAIRQLVPLMSGVQQPVTMVYNERRYPLICKMLPERLTCYYSKLALGPFGHGKRLLSTLSQIPKLLSGLDSDEVLGEILTIFQPVLKAVAMD
jgi:hypothetical protein